MALFNPFGEAARDLDGYITAVALEDSSDGYVLVEFSEAAEMPEDGGDDYADTMEIVEYDDDGELVVSADNLASFDEDDSEYYDE